jgi:hypothetical protein
LAIAGLGAAICIAAGLPERNLASAAAAAAAAKPGHKSVTLKVSIAGVPMSITSGHPVVLRVRVSNVGRIATRGRVTVTTTAGRGLSIARRYRLMTIAALQTGQSRTLQIPVTLNAASAGVTVRATARHATAAVSSIVLMGGSGGSGPNPAPSPNPAPGPVPAPRPNPLVGTYWWSFQADYSDGVQQNNTGFYFVNNTSVYSGLPTGGLPTSCTVQALNASLPVDQQNACVSYAYNAATGAVTIGTTTGTYAGGALTVGSTQYQPLTIEPAGFTTDAQLQVIQVFGYCGLACTVDTTNLGLASTGQFYLATGTLGSITIGTGGTYASLFPPNETGTYTVDSNGAITLHFGDGSTQTHTFAAEGADPETAGIVLDQLSYLPPPPGG